MEMADHNIVCVVVWPASVSLREIVSLGTFIVDPVIAWEQRALARKKRS